MIDEKPNAIIIYNNSNFISPKLINYISNLGIKIIFYLTDLEFITGGCHYSFNCENYKINCKNCPATKFLIKNIPNKIFLEKKKNYFNSNIIFLSPNDEIYKKVYDSKIFNLKNHKNYNLIFVIDTNIYKPGTNKNSSQLKICFRSSLNPEAIFLLKSLRTFQNEYF